MSLTTDLVTFLKTTPEVKELVRKGTIASDPVKYPEGYIFEGKPYAHIDNLSRSCTVVIYSKDVWDVPPRGSRVRFPIVVIEVWAAPTKNSDGTVAEYDAEDVIHEVFQAFEPYVHIARRSEANGAVYKWGSTPIIDSIILDGPKIRSILNAQGSNLGEMRIGVTR